MFRPVGGTKELHSDFRLVAATNRNLSQMVSDGNFRCDLLFRLQSLPITLPPLKERLDDIRELVTYFLGKLSERYNQETKGIAPDLIEALMSHNWPGNVRELYQIVEQIFAEHIGTPTLFSIHLPRELRVRLARANVQQGQRNTNSSTSSLPSWKDFKKQNEQQYIETLRKLDGHNIQEACRISGLSRARMYQLLDKYGLTTSLQK